MLCPAMRLRILTFKVLLSENLLDDLLYRLVNGPCGKRGSCKFLAFRASMLAGFRVVVQT